MRYLRHHCKYAETSDLFILIDSFIRQVYSLIVLYLSICFAVSHVRAWFTEPGYPERIATATGALRRNFSREELKMMSPNMKQLINKRNKGFVALLNSGGQ